LSVGIHSIKLRRGHNKAVIAVCRSMLVAIYYMLSRDESFKEVSESKATEKKSRQNSILIVPDDLLIQELIKRGYKLEPVT